MCILATCHASVVLMNGLVFFLLASSNDLRLHVCCFLNQTWFSWMNPPVL
ncbi:hypothetical protein HanPI659440_Chr12g0467511 [Helianthus annuus]|nr:hypothetical protein HanPI659440_Chr12g0467511 [Helianthus annuus]